LAVVVRNDAGDDFHQCALAGAVFSDDGVDFTGSDREGDAMECLDSVESAGDVAEFEDGSGVENGHLLARL
jgi:hypothetical protein